MKYYSEVLDKLFDTEEELFKTERDFKLKEEKNKEKENLTLEIQVAYDHLVYLAKKYVKEYNEPAMITISEGIAFDFL